MNRTIFEDKNFAAIKCFESRDYIDLRIKHENICVTSAHIINFLSSILLKYSGLCIFVTLNNFELIKKLQTIGFKLEGYLVSGDVRQGEKYQLWEYDSYAYVQNINEDVRFKRIIRVFLKFSGHLRASQFKDSRKHIEYFFSADHFPIESVDSSERLVSKVKNDKSFKNHTELKIDNKNFREIVAGRRSAELLSEVCSFESIKKIFEFALSFQEKNLRPVGLTSGIGDYQVYHIRTFEEKGVFLYNAELNSFEKSHENVEHLLLVHSSLNQQNFQNCGNWIFITTSYQQMLARYGTKSVRLSLLDAGGIIQQMHLIATSLDMKFRVLGSFDDLLLKKIIGLEDDVHILCGAGVSE